MKLETLKCTGYQETDNTLVATIRSENRQAVIDELVGRESIRMYTDNEPTEYYAGSLYGYKYLDRISETEDGEFEIVLRRSPITVGEVQLKKIAAIDEFDRSGEVNAFSLNGKDIWLPKSDRVGLMNSINIEMAMGKETTTLWLGELNLTLDCRQAIQMLSALEMYALQCYNKTAEHKAAVMGLTSIEEVNDYEYKTGYPAKLEFNLN